MTLGTYFQNRKIDKASKVKTPLQNPLYFRTSYCIYSKGNKCTHTKRKLFCILKSLITNTTKEAYAHTQNSLIKSPILYSLLLQHKQTNIHIKFHKAWKHPHIKPLEPKKGRQIHIKLTYKQSLTTLKC